MNSYIQKVITRDLIKSHDPNKKQVNKGHNPTPLFRTNAKNG